MPLTPPTVLILASGRGERFKASGGTVHKLQSLLAGKPVLQHTLDAVRAMSHPEIKAAYKAQLHNTDHSASDDISRGAGLGWLTIARDASAPLQYHIATGEDAAETAPHAVFHVKALI